MAGYRKRREPDLGGILDSVEVVSDVGKGNVVNIGAIQKVVEDGAGVGGVTLTLLNAEILNGVSVSGKLSEVLESIRFSRDTGIYNGYCGPCKAILQNMNIF